MASSPKIAVHPPLLLLACAMALAVGLGGCKRDTARENTAEAKRKPSTLRVVVVGDPPLAEALELQWKARIESELKLEQMTVDQLETLKQLNADIIIYPSACLGTLVERDLIASPSADVLDGSQYRSRDVFELQRRAEVRWGDAILGFSFGSPQLLLMYRADLFEKQGLQPPSTWTEFDDVVRRLTRSELGEWAPPEGQPWSAVVQPIGEGWGGRVLLARAAAYASHPGQFSTLFDYTTMEPLITGPPFERALEELIASFKTGPADAISITPEAARRAVMGGAAGMALTWSSEATADGQPLPLAEGVQIGFAELPGSTTVYNFAEGNWTPRDEQAQQVPLLGVAGRLASPVRDARRPREAAEILALLSGADWSAQIFAHSTATTLYRQSQMRTPGLWTDANLPRDTTERYVKLVEKTQSRPLYMTCIRIPGWQRYLTALDEAVVAACTGRKTSSEALAQVADAWQMITSELGLEAQRVAYTRSLGLEP